ncbi:MAG: hypothetical protein U0169_10350 [Polyangiaceae bacterium]
MVRRPTVALFALLSLVAGCEGARENGLLDGLDGAIVDGNGERDSSAASEDASGRLDDATVPEDASTTEPADATTSEDAATTPDGGRDAKATDAATDARTTDAADAGPRDDAGDGSDGSRDAGVGSRDAGDSGANPERVVECGSFQCDVGTEVCCRTRNSVTTVFTCTPTGACPTNADAGVLAIPCDHNDDCAAAGMIGNVCCIEFESSRITGVSCKPISACAFDTDTVSYVCDPDRNDAFNCPAPTGTDLECTPNPSAAFPYGICREM